LDTHGGLKNFSMNTCPSNHITGLFWTLSHEFLVLPSLAFLCNVASNLRFDANLMYSFCRQCLIHVE
jgi:hypothetical protein